jgi:hypothetical protein
MEKLPILAALSHLGGGQRDRGGGWRDASGGTQRVGSGAPQSVDEVPEGTAASRAVHTPVPA